jgi:hypothetical protein
MNPDDLLAQIAELSAAYLDAGGDPGALAEAAGGATGDVLPPTGGDAGMPPPDGGMGMPPPDAGGMPPEDGGNPMESMMPSSPPSGFGEASAMAEEDMKKRKAKAY